jgi:hypothetical protein
MAAAEKAFQKFARETLGAEIRKSKEQHQKAGSVLS